MKKEITICAQMVLITGNPIIPFLCLKSTLENLTPAKWNTAKTLIRMHKCAVWVISSYIVISVRSACFSPDEADFFRMGLKLNCQPDTSLTFLRGFNLHLRSYLCFALQYRII